MQCSEHFAMLCTCDVSGACTASNECLKAPGQPRQCGQLTLTTALALALGSTLTWTMRLPCFGAAVTTTSRRAPGSSGLFWPPQAFTQFVRSRKADMPCKYGKVSNC